MISTQLHLRLGPLAVMLRLRLPADGDAQRAILRRLAFFEAPEAPDPLLLELDCTSNAWPRPGEETLTRLLTDDPPGGLRRLRRWDLDLWLSADRRRLEGAAAPMTSSVEEGLRVLFTLALLRESTPGLLIHAACTVYKGEAWLFPAFSGVGKSTLAALTPGDLALTDELVLLTLHPEGWRAWPSFFWNFERAWGGAAPAQVSYPLRHLRFPRQATHTAFAPLPADEALTRLLQQTLAYPLEMDAAARLFSTAADLLDALPPHHIGELALERGAWPYTLPRSTTP